MLLAVEDRVYVIRKVVAAPGDFILDFKHLKTHKVRSASEYVVHVGAGLPIMHTDYVVLELLLT